MFQLEAVQAKDGDCLLLHYDVAGKPGLILIDGGSTGVYSKFLKPRLEQLRGSSVLRLRMVIVSHIDADHITGLVDLFKKLADLQANGQELPYRIDTLWHNAFGKLVRSHTAAVQSQAVGAAMGGATSHLPDLTPMVEAVVSSVKQGDDLRRLATGIVRDIMRYRKTEIDAMDGHQVSVSIQMANELKSRDDGELVSAFP